MKHETAIPIGSGGMGEVFKAWDPDLQRHIALKYLRHDNPLLLERFLREARAQARVDHPSVCKVYEVNEEGGRPYIAMEYVDGETIDVAARRLTLEQTLLLVRKITEAVQAAHAVGLIHRDLKPANILVVDRDGEPHPFVLDFGIARVEELAELTMTGQVMGTPGYLSPEQAHGNIENIDRRTDVFSLGVILYELLAGTKPFEGESTVEILLNLIEIDPAPLRARAPHIPRDLETVVMTCLEKDPERRYGSARALADDLGRFLDGEPVEARPVSASERLVRRARKHPFTTAAITLAGLALAALLIGAIGGWAKYTADLKWERDVAEAREVEAREISDFLVGAFSLADPDEADGEEVTAREILDRGAEQIEKDLADRPETQARLLGIMGEVYSRLGLNDRALPLLERGLELTLASPEPSPEAVIKARVRLADLYLHLAEFDKAAEITGPIPDLVASTPSLDTPHVVQALGCVGRIQMERDQLAEAAETLTLAVERAERDLGPDAPLVGDLLSDLCTIASEQHLWDDAIAQGNRSLEIRERAYGPDDPRVATTLNNLAIAYKGAGRLEEAAAVGERMLEIRERLLGPMHPRTGTALNNLGLVYKYMGDLDRAEELYLRALEVRTTSLGEDHPRVATVYNNLGGIYRDRGDLDGAEAAHNQGLAIMENALGPDHSSVYYPLAGLAKISMLRHDFAEAELLYLRALHLREAATNPESPALIGTLRMIGESRLGLGNYDGAQESLDRARRIAVESQGEDSENVARIDELLTEVAAARECNGA